MSKMGTITDKKNELIAAIRDGKIFARYEKARKAIGEYPEKKALADGFREQSYLMAVEHRDGSEEIRLLLEKRSELTADPVIAEYLAAELDLCRMLQRISMQILNVADLELDSFSESIRI